MTPRGVLEKCIFVFVIAAALRNVANFTLEDEIELLKNLDVSGYAALYNMTLDRVKALTSDGWLIELHRVRNMEVFDAKLSTPVIISHGCGCSSMDYMVNPRNESIIFIYADLGYDVWAINYRANKFSNNVLVNGSIRAPRETDYYRATWQYMAERDFPAAVETVLHVTRQDKIYVIGQSMGATILFAALSETRKFDDKILLYGSLVPVIKFGEDTAPKLKRQIAAAPLLPRLAKDYFKPVFGHQIMDLEQAGTQALHALLNSSLCKDIPTVCLMVVGLMESHEENEKNPHMNPARDRLYHTINPAGMTLMNLYQFARQSNKSVWEKLDYDEVKETRITNMQEYNQPKPPKYNFTAIAVPLQLYFVKKDKYFGTKTAMSVVKDLRLKNEDFRMVQDNFMEHHDVVWGWDARCFVYDHLQDRIERIESSRSHERAR